MTKLKEIDENCLKLNDLDIYKWGLGIQATIIATITALAGKFTFQFFKKKDEDNRETNKENRKAFKSLDKRMLKIESSLVIRRDSMVNGKIQVEEIPLNRYTRELSHKLTDFDKARTTTLSIILDEVKSLKTQEENNLAKMLKKIEDVKK